MASAWPKPFACLGLTWMEVAGGEVPNPSWTTGLDAVSLGLSSVAAVAGAQSEAGAAWSLSGRLLEVFAWLAVSCALQGRSFWHTGMKAYHVCCCGKR